MGIVLVVPDLRQLTNVVFIQSSVLKIISGILAMIGKAVVSGWNNMVNGIKGLFYGKCIQS